MKMSIADVINKPLLSQLIGGIEKVNSFHQEFSEVVMKGPIWLYNYKIEPDEAQFFESRLARYADHLVRAPENPDAIDHSAKVVFHKDAENSLCTKDQYDLANRLIFLDSFTNILNFRLEKKFQNDLVAYNKVFQEKMFAEVDVYAYAEAVTELLGRSSLMRPNELSDSNFNMEFLFDDCFLESLEEITKKAFKKFEMLTIFEVVMISLIETMYDEHGYSYCKWVVDAYILILTEFDHSVKSISSSPEFREYWLDFHKKY